MKKYTNKKKTTITIAFMGILGLCAVMGMSQKEYKSTYASVEPSTQAVVYDDIEREITFSITELSYTYNNLVQCLNDNYSTLSDDELNLSSVYYIDITFTCSDYSKNDSITWEDSNTQDQIMFSLDGVNTFSYRDFDGLDYIEGNFTDGISIYLNDVSPSNYQSIKSAIELDIQANQPASQGDSIISAITSGLGLAPDVANEFVKGFTAVFWDSTNSSLTKISNFMLVMLGIAMVMAIIKLSLSLVRSNTGA